MFFKHMVISCSKIQVEIFSVIFCFQWCISKTGFAFSVWNCESCVERSKLNKMCMAHIITILVSFIPVCLSPYFHHIQKRKRNFGRRKHWGKCYCLMQLITGWGFVILFPNILSPALSFWAFCVAALNGYLEKSDAERGTNVHTSPFL